MSDAAKDENLLVGFAVSHGAHRVVTQAEEPVADWSVFDADP